MYHILLKIHQTLQVIGIDDSGEALYIEFDEDELPYEENHVKNLEMSISEDNVITAKLNTNSFYAFMGKIEEDKIQKTVDGTKAELNS